MDKSRSTVEMGKLSSNASVYFWDFNDWIFDKFSSEPQIFESLSIKSFGEVD